MLSNMTARTTFLCVWVALLSCINANADSDKAGSIVFTDDFNAGRKPDWKVIRGAWGDVGGMLRATTINNGATSSDRPTLVTTLAGVPGRPRHSR